MTAGTAGDPAQPDEFTQDMAEIGREWKRAERSARKLAQSFARISELSAKHGISLQIEVGTSEPRKEQP